MNVSEEEPNGNGGEEKDDQIHQQETVRFRGKDIPIEKFQKRMSRKPKIYGAILINISIILIIIIVILLFF